MASDKASAPPPAVEVAERDDKSATKEGATKKQKPGFFVRIWRGIFGGREDFEKRLQYLSKEEATVHARIKKRAHSSRRMVRNLIAISILSEIVAVVYAIATTRSPDMDWQMRAVRVLPMFLLPFLSSALYSAQMRLTRMLDSKDQNKLEKLRAERKVKIDELKERTNYYSTQQLIQKYDLDPAAKAAAASVLASKLGADSGLKLFVGDESNADPTLARSSDIELSQSNAGLRNRRLPQAGAHTMGSTTVVQNSSMHEVGSDGQEMIEKQGPMVVGHYNGQAVNDGGWIARIAALLVGEDPTQSYALICGNCLMHNGLARKEDFPHITYYCPHCNALNTSNQSEVRLPSPSARENPVTSIAEVQTSVTATDSEVVQTSVTATDSEVVSSVPVVQELPEKDAPEDNKEKEAINEKEES
ncbi:putative integral membrane zinc-ribbon metal-binding protein [Carex littledalei]|uniref:Putative integral membrane zinc-ribbon metal-binding protein n=1 Tax=Carex littledalei TaxID=544730 RepID=A0A833QMJ4_9POAL|nr:putative integral membrane zinc-ribbon metal-binding protein [Carex littledalei]